MKHRVECMIMRENYKFDSVFHDFQLKMTVNMSKCKKYWLFLFICFLFFV